MWDAALVNLLLFTVAAWAAAALFFRSYLSLWMALQEGAFAAGTAGSRPTVRAAPGVPQAFRGPLGAIFAKEWLSLVRNPRSALWLGFMLSLWFVQITLNFFIQRNLVRYGETLAGAAHILEALHLVVTLYFMSAFMLRFVFPAMSAERRTAWIIGSAPVDLGRVFLAKLWFYAVAFVGIGLAMAAFGASAMQVPLEDAPIFFGIVAVAVGTVVASGLALGARFPNFETDDPELLATSLPGLGLTAGCLGYGALGAWLLYGFLEGDSLLPLSLYLAGSVIAAYALVRMPLGFLRRMEFSGEGA
jgi:hypothetical protein